MEEKYKKFKEYNWVDSEEWQIYYTNLFPTPPPSKVLRYKKKFYRNKIDPDFDIDYKPPEEEANSYSSANTSSSSSSSYSSNNTYSNANPPNQDAFSTEQTFETYRAAQSLANPIRSAPLQLIETLFLVLFIISLPFRYKTTLIGIIAFLIRTIRFAGIPKFDLTYLQVFIMNDSCHTLLFTVQTLSDRLNYYMMLPVVVSTIIAICDNLKSMNLSLGGLNSYIDMVNNKKEELTQSKSYIEVAIGFVSIAGIFLKLNSILTPIIYWQLMRVRYTLNPYIKKSFSDLNDLANKLKNNDKCPGPVKFIIEKVQWAFSFMGKISNPQNGQNGQQQGNNNQGGMGSMCNIF